MIEALHHSRGREALLNDSARAPWCGRELLIDAVDLVPIVHGVDEDFAGEEIAWELTKAVHGDRQDDEVGIADDFVG